MSNKVFVEYKVSEWDREYDFFHRRHKAWWQGITTKRVEFDTADEAMHYIKDCVKNKAHQLPTKEHQKINSERAFMKFEPLKMSDYSITFG